MPITLPKNVILITAGVFFQFLGFDGAQQFFVPLFANEGKREIALTGLILLYACFLFANFFASGLVARIGLKRSLILGSLPYALFAFAIASDIPMFIYIASFLVGIGAGLFWNANTQLIEKSSTFENVGRYQGLKMSSLLWANFFSALVATPYIGKIDTATLYLIFGAITALSLVLYQFVEDCKVDPPVTVWIGVKQLFSVQILYLLPTIVGGAYLISQAITGIKLLVLENFGLEYVGSTAIALKAAGGCGAIVAGTLADKWSKKGIIHLGSFLGIAGILLLITAQFSWQIYVGAIFVGLSFSTIYPGVQALIKTYIPEGARGNAAGSYHLFATIGYLLAYVMADAFLPEIALIIAIPFLIFGSLLVMKFR